MNKPLLSICIPTFERAEMLKKTIQSIVAQEASEEYEICISDNSASNQVEEMMTTFVQPNIVYKHIKPVGAYMNLIRALEMGNGLYLKLINAYSTFRIGAVQKMIDEIKKHDVGETVISWTNGERVDYYGDKSNDFIKSMGIYTTWGVCFGIWRNQFIDFYGSCELNEMFPHVSLLFENCKHANRYSVVNERLFINQELEKKGGYSIPDVFGRQYVGMLEELYTEGIIEIDTLAEQKDRVIQFIGHWKGLCLAYPDRYTFNFEKDIEIMEKVFGTKAVRTYKSAFYKTIIKEKIKKVIRR